MEFQPKSYPIIYLFILLGYFLNLECWSILLSDVIYEDIESLNATCKLKDSCLVPRINDTLEEYNCNCDSSCSFYGTCCVDSKYRQRYPKTPNIHCGQYFDDTDKKIHFYPIINKCNPDLESDNITKELCDTYSNDDPFLLIPVTDPVTGMSYRNYYCFACNENPSEKEPMPWNVRLESKSEKVIRHSLPNLYYDKTRWGWVMDYGEENATSVAFKTFLPEELKTAVPFCFNIKITSDCAPDWTDEDVRQKCLAYMALTRIRKERTYSWVKIFYRNPHCAICNFESVENMMCDGKDENYEQHFVKSGDFFVGLFYLRNEECGDGMVFDNFTKKCRRIYRSKIKLY